MPSFSTTPGLAAVIADQSIPAITYRNRLEGRPRTNNFDRALRAEVRDALWMLTRQWQMGEFEGDDAGSPIFARVQMSSTRLGKYEPANGPAEPFDTSVPLEAKVERRPVRFVSGGREVSLNLRLLLGRQWLKLMAGFGATVRAEFLERYPIHEPDPNLTQDAVYCAHPEAWSAFAAVSGRRMDGAKLYFHLLQPGAHASDGIPSLTGMDAAVAPIADRFKLWFQRLIFQPEEQTGAWEPDRLEYQFTCSAPTSEGESVFTAEQYYTGHLDWYNFELDRQKPALADVNPPPAPPDPPKTLDVLPASIGFNGMPDTRWWAFEDSRTNFGDIKPDTTDLPKLLLIEFGLIYANDWFVIPYTVPAGSLSKIRGLAVTNVFGERTWVRAAGAGVDDAWQRWAMFLVSIKGHEREVADTSLLLLPTAGKVLESPVLEEVMFVRDEVANMVWGIERTITLPSGQPKPGREAGHELHAFLQSKIGPVGAPVPASGDAKIRYRVMTSVPEQWVPFIPVHVDEDNRQTQLQRAAMPRILDRDPQRPRKVVPRTSLLREGLDRVPQETYFVHEEEVPRAGIVVTQRFQRTRWRDGRAWVWLGVRKQTGRGEASSGLAFYRIVDVPPPT